MPFFKVFKTIRNIAQGDHSSSVRSIEINQTQSGNMLILSLSGKIDAMTSKELEAALNSLTGHDGVNIVLDMGGVEYISSSGLRILMAALNRVRQSHGDLVLTSLQPMVMEVFEITGIKRFFSIYPNKSDALNSLKP
jgi:anti-sigma B factor antagonist